MKQLTLVLANAAVVLGLGAAVLAAQSNSTILERVLVRVNGEIFTQSDLTQQQTDVIRFRQEQPRAIPEGELLKLLNEVTPDILVDAVDELLIVQHGRELGLVFTDTEFNRGIDTLKKENNMDDAQFKEALTQEGLTLAELRSNFERAWMRQMVQAREIFPRMRITEEEMRQYYAANRTTFMTPERVTIREIALLAPMPAPGTADPMTSAFLTSTRNRIEAVRQRALSGEDFVALVKELSDAPTRANGGVIGPVNVQDINPAVKAVLDSMKPGEISEPLQVARGFQILKLETREPPEQQPFDKVRDEIELAIRNVRLEAEMVRLKARLRTDAVIEWKDDNLRRIYEARLKERLVTGERPLP